MSIMSILQRWFDMVFRKKAKEEFDIRPATSELMESIAERCGSIYAGHPAWIDADDHIKTINFAKTICSEVAALTTLAIKIQISGSARADWLQQEIDDIYYLLRHWCEYADAYGTAILKPNGDSVDLVLPGDFIITAKDGEKVTGAVFIDRATDDKYYYTRLEYHRFDGDIYRITNKCYRGTSEDDVSKEVDIKTTPWNDLDEEVALSGLERPLFAVLRTPKANNAEVGSAMGLPVFYDALSELEDLDIAYSRTMKEIKDSKRTVLLDSDRLLPSGGKVSNTAAAFKRKGEQMGLPDYVKSVYGDGRESFYHEINPTLNTDARLTGFNALLSQIGFKCGFSDGYFVFDQKTGMITATQVESDDRRTIQSIKDHRDKLQDCIDNLVYALNAFADLYGLAPQGSYEIVYDFGDITYNREEDRLRWWQYVQANKVPAWMYFVKFEGMTEEDAKAMAEEAKPETPALFGEE